MSCMTKLRDGRQVLLRRIRPDDKDGLVRGLRALSARSVQRRFLSPKRSFSQAELRYLTEVDGRNHVALVAESPTEPSRRLLGVARFIRWHDDPEAAEAAIVVADDWQGRGLGTALARQLAARARGLGIKRFTATMAADNLPALRLMETLSFELERRHYGPTNDLVTRIAA
jgi:RimJ/RimL family protein N-acetyltransferase